MSAEARDALLDLTQNPTDPIQEGAHRASARPYSVACIAARIKEGELQKLFAAGEEYRLSLLSCFAVAVIIFIFVFFFIFKPLQHTGHASA